MCQIFFGVWQLFSFSLRRGLWSSVCQVSPCLEVAVVFLSGVPRGDVIFCSLSSVVVPQSICHFRHYKMDESPVNCWLKQMVKIRKDKGFQGLQTGQTTRKYCLLEIKSKLSNRGREQRWIICHFMSNLEVRVFWWLWWSEGDICIMVNNSVCFRFAKCVWTLPKPSGKSVGKLQGYGISYVRVLMFGELVVF